MSVSVNDKIQLIYNRIGLPALRTQLGTPFGITARGLGDFASRFSDLAESDDAVEVFIDSFWEQLLYGGRRLLQVYRYSDDSELDKLDSYFETLEVDLDSEFVLNYPYPVPDITDEDNSFHFAELTDHQSHDHHLNSSMFCCKAYYTATEDLDDQLLTDDGIELKRNGAKIVCRQRLVTQCYNYVAVDRERKLIILSIDMANMPIADAHTVLSRFQNHLRNHAGLQLTAPVNLFPAIDTLYSSPDGSIASLSFLTSDGNPSNLSLKPPKRCLREDTYHHGGEEAAQVLSKYKLGKTWDVYPDDDTESAVTIGIELPGRKAMLYNTDKLKEAISFRCPSINEVVFVLNKLLNAL